MLQSCKRSVCCFKIQHHHTHFDIQYQNIMNLKVVDYGNVINTFAKRTKMKHKILFLFFQNDLSKIKLNGDKKSNNIKSVFIFVMFHK